MKKTYFLTVFLLFSSFITLISCSKDDEPGNLELDPNASINFPDANFKAALLEHGNTITGQNISLIDTNNDGEIQIREAQNYSGEIAIGDKQITDLSGLEHFKNIIKLFAYANQIAQIDLSKNTMLTELGLEGNQIAQIDLSKNTKLTYLDLHVNQIAQIDLSKNTKLTYLDLSNNEISQIDLSKNTELTSLDLRHNQIAQIDLSNNTVLTYLDLRNNQIAQIDLSSNTELTYLRLYSNQIAQIDLSNNTELTNLDLRNNQIAQIDLSNNTELTYLDLRFNPNLTCIQIAAGFTPTSSWYKDATASYSDNCQ